MIKFNWNAGHQTAGFTFLTINEMNITKLQITLLKNFTHFYGKTVKMAMKN
jgi:hypothetical protein